MCTWCNGYHLTNKSVVRLITFHIALISWVSNRADRVLQPWLDNRSRLMEKKPLNSNQLNST